MITNSLTIYEMICYERNKTCVQFRVMWSVLPVKTDKKWIKSMVLSLYLTYYIKENEKSVRYR